VSAITCPFVSSAHPADAVVRPAGGYRAAELAAAAAGLLPPLLFATSFKLVAWTPKYLALPLIAAAGFCMIPAVLRGAQRRVALLALAFGAWAGVATIAATDRNVAFWGRYSIGTGLLFVMALIGAWMLGAAMRPGATRLVERALLIACVVNAGVALVQQVVDLSSYGLAVYQGRSAGLYGNPVYLAELLAGGLWLAVCRFERGGSAHRAAAAAALVLSAGVAVSGSRFGLGLAVVAALLALPRLGWRRGAAAAVVIAVGLGAGTLLGAAGFGGAGTTSVARVEAAPANGVRPRLETWRAAVTAIADRPLLGWGPSGFLAATSPHRTLALARNEGAGRLFADAHDVVIEYAVTTGLPGLALLLAWIVVAARRRWREPLLGFALFVLALTLAEPLHVGVTPVAFLALGAAGASGAHSPAARRWAWAAAGSVVGIAGLVATAVLGLGFVGSRRAELDNRPKGAADAARLLPGWSQPAELVACLDSFADISAGASGPSAVTLKWYTTAAHRDPADPAPWIDLGNALRLRDPAAAAAAFDHALARDPWSAGAALGLAAVDPQRGPALRARATLVGAKSPPLGGCSS